MTVAVHPGEVLREALEERGMSQAAFAERMCISKKHTNLIVNGKAGYSASTALNMERVLGIKAEVWMNLQSAYDLEMARRVVGATR